MCPQNLLNDGILASFFKILKNFCHFLEIHEFPYPNRERRLASFDELSIFSTNRFLNNWRSNPSSNSSGMKIGVNATDGFQSLNRQKNEITNLMNQIFYESAFFVLLRIDLWNQNREVHLDLSFVFDVFNHKSELFFVRCKKIQQDFSEASMHWQRRVFVYFIAQNRQLSVNFFFCPGLKTFFVDDFFAQNGNFSRIFDSYDEFNPVAIKVHKTSCSEEWTILF